MKPLYLAAQEFVRRGWSVIPVSASTKQPMVAWKEFQERYATPDELHKWFNGEVQVNIGIVTGKISKLMLKQRET